MAGQIRVSPQDLRAAAPTFSASGEAVSAALRALTGALPESGGMCGGDEAGAAFRASYDKGVQQITAAMGVISTGLSSLDPGLVATADNIERADTTSVMRSSG